MQDWNFWKNKIYRDNNNLIAMANTYNDYYYKWSDFVLKYNKELFESVSKSFLDFRLGDGEIKKIQKIMRTTFDSALEQNLCKENIASSLAKLVDSWLSVVKISGYDRYHSSFTDFLSAWIRLFDPIRNTIGRTPSEVIKMKGKFNLHHYKTNGEKKHRTPLLIVYSLINRYYILDLMPHASVINNLREQGFEIFTTDWGTPDFYNKDLTIEHYAHDYIGNAVDKIKEITGSDNVSLFGYCWGGLFALIYAASYPENVKNLILHATPVDMSQDRVVVENWTAHMDADKLVDTLGNVPGWFVNSAFVLRNPVETFLKYPLFFGKPKSLQEIQQFFWIETWLYDSKPIIGETYREIINKICKNNLLMKNKMRVGDHCIDLKNITMPTLNILGSYDDLVPPQSSKPITSLIGSTDKKLIEFPTGHVGLCIGQKAHEQLWPEVGNWLAQRS